MQIGLRGAALCVVMAAAGACGNPAPGQTFYQRNIEPILTQKCGGNTSGCHQPNTDDPYQFTAGNFDVTSFESVQKRRDVLAPFGAYSYPLLLIKAVGANQLTFNYNGTLKPIQVQHSAGAIIEVSSDAFFTLQSWLGNGATENGLPPATPAAKGTGDCSTAVPDGFVAATYTANPNYGAFTSTVEPIFEAHGCNAGSCHGAPESDFYITCGTDDNQKAFNFSQAWSFVNTPVADSQILRVPLAVASGGRGHTGGDQFASTTDKDYEAIATWATAVGVLDFAQGDPVKTFFKDNVQPILVERGCSFQACHSASATNDFKLRSGTPQGFYSAIALQKNYDLLLQDFTAIELPDARRGRAIAKTILADDPRVGNGAVAGIVHRGGPVLESPGSGAADPTACAQPWDDTQPAFCTIQEWIRLERAALGLPLMASGDTLPLVYVSRTAAAPAGRLEFDTFQGGADLRVAAATLGALQTIASVDTAGSKSLLATCTGLTAGTADVQAPDVGPDGVTVAFAARNAATDPLEVYTVNVDGTGCKQVTPSAPDSNGIHVHNFDPAWSPDGLWLVFASTRGGAGGAALSRKRMLPQSDLWRIKLSDSTTEQVTFLSNSEVSPQMMREGRITMTTEKASDGFYQLSGRRINWDLTDYHPLLAQRKVSPYADLTMLATTNPSIGFDAGTDIREGTDGTFLLILSDVDASGKPVLAGGAGALATFNRSLGPFESGRMDKGYLPSVKTFDPTGTASGHMGATGGYRGPVDLPDGTIMVSFTTDATAPTWNVVQLNPRTNTQTTLIPNAVDAVVAYPYPARPLFTNHRQLVFGGSGGGTDTAHAVLHMPDAPMLFTLLTGNLRRGRPVDAFRKATHLKVYTEGACPPGTSCTADAMGVYQMRTVLGSTPLAKDGSVRVQLPAKTGMVFALVDDNDKEIVTMTEEHQLGPGEAISMGVSQQLFDVVCAGCHGSVAGTELDVGVNADALTGASQSLSATATPAVVGQ